MILQTLNQVFNTGFLVQLIYVSRAPKTGLLLCGSFFRFVLYKFTLVLDLFEGE